MIRVENKFKNLRQKKQKAFGVFLTAGYTSLEYSKDIFKKIILGKFWPFDDNRSRFNSKLITKGCGCFIINFFPNKYSKESLDINFFIRLALNNS